MPKKKYLFDKVVIVGVGLMGASLGMNLLRHKKARSIVGVGRSRANLNTAKQKKAITDIFTGANLDAAWSEADLIVLATPVAAIDQYLKSIGQAAKKGLVRPKLVVTDVGSTKESIVKSAQRYLSPQKVAFVGAHPIAGTEQSRAQAAFHDLYKGKVCVLTPDNKKTPYWAAANVKRLWHTVGARTVTMTPRQHDQLLAHCSHLPHMVAYSLMHVILTQPKALPLIGGSFKDFTRIAASDPEMWRDISLENKRALLKAIQLFEKKLSVLKTAIKKGDGKALSRLFTQARHLRRQL
jgi:prephenate dehydrogenase